MCVTQKLRQHLRRRFPLCHAPAQPWPQMLPGVVASALLVNGPERDLVMGRPGRLPAAVARCVLHFLGCCARRTVRRPRAVLFCRMCHRLAREQPQPGDGRQASARRGVHHVSAAIYISLPACRRGRRPAVYGGEHAEVITNMEAAGLEPAEKDYVQRLAAATATLQAIPLVTKVTRCLTSQMTSTRPACESTLTLPSWPSLPGAISRRNARQFRGARAGPARPLPPSPLSCTPCSQRTQGSKKTTKPS